LEPGGDLADWPPVLDDELGDFETMAWSQRSVGV